MAGRKYELILKHLSGQAAAVVKVVHGDYVGVTAPAAADVDVGKLLAPLKRTVYEGKARPHMSKPAVKMTVAGQIRIPAGSTVVVFARKKSNQKDPTIILVAVHRMSDNKLLAFCKEISVSKPKEHERKANISKLRRMRRPNEEVFYVWSRDQYRFTIKKA